MKEEKKYSLSYYYSDDNSESSIYVNDVFLGRKEQFMINDNTLDGKLLISKFEEIMQGFNSGKDTFILMDWSHK
jgi:hypothetical protein